MPNPVAVTWDQFLCAARGGDRDALGALVEQFRPFLDQVARGEIGRGLRAKAGASDMVQETLLVAARDFSAFEGQTPAHLRGWLQGIIRHKLLDQVRDFRGRGQRAVEREIPLDVHTERPTDSTAPLDRAIRREQLDALRVALERLPEAQREAIRLRNQEGLSFEEIARRLNRGTADAARMLWGRAVQALRASLHPEP
jgi:RNA polymerase sigma-70 factor, ECF subfamily